MIGELVLLDRPSTSDEFPVAEGVGGTADALAFGDGTAAGVLASTASLLCSSFVLLRSACGEVTSDMVRRRTASF